MRHIRWSSLSLVVLVAMHSLLAVGGVAQLAVDVVAVLVCQLVVPCASG